MGKSIFKVTACAILKVAVLHCLCLAFGVELPLLLHLSFALVDALIHLLLD